MIIKLLTIFKYSIVYREYTSRRNDLMNIDGVDLNSSKAEVATLCVVIMMINKLISQYYK